MSSDEDGPAAVCVDVVKTYRTATESVTALDGVTLAVPRARVTVVVGPSGSGKSSLLRLLACIDSPDAGEVRIAGQRVDRLGARGRRRLRQRQVAYLFQRPGENLLPYLDAVEQVRLAAELRGAPVPADEARDLLDRLGLGHRADHSPGRLSGGEQQRLAVACGVVGGPALVVADEPTAELDTAAAERVLAAMEELAAGGVGFVVSSHDPRVMAIADGFIRLDHGRLVAA
ncbi:ATP-binding cassette domain-containing protein [Modestobacter sp. NPDC049651]|uniref:ABC transporter ATP-binding protein n=1 Tax=unclassified Modestobacter TaxID=2643866 RepID=UPI0033DDC444